MATSNFFLKLNQPKELPAEGVTSVSFKPWKNHLKNFLQQDVNNYMFLQGGIYSTWKAANESVDGKRIQAVHNDDLERKEITGDLTPEELTNRNNHNAKLLLTRNSQLGKMIQHIVSFVHYTEANKNGLTKRQLCSLFHGYYDITGLILSMPLFLTKLALRECIMAEDKSLSQKRLWEGKAPERSLELTKASAELFFQRNSQKHQLSCFFKYKADGLNKTLAKCCGTQIQNTIS